MCSMYWNLTVDFTCPVPDCGAENVGAELQTHWMGDVGSCSNRYAIGQSVDELDGIEAETLGPGGPDDLIGHCDSCQTFIDFGARVENGAVVEVWPYAYGHPRVLLDVAPRGR